LIYKHTQRKLDGEFSNSSEVTWGFIPGTPSIGFRPTVITHYSRKKNPVKQKAGIFVRASGRQKL